MKVVEPARLAAEARSILSCPATVELVVDGATLTCDAPSSMRDSGGTPTFLCPLDSALSFAGAAGQSALVKLTSGLEAGATLHLAGQLRTAGREACACCDEVRDVVTVDLTYALLVSVTVGADGEERETRRRVPLAEFRSGTHDLNRGYLALAARHANDCHQDELRRAVSSRFQVRLGSVVGVHLSDLTPEGVTLDWVDLDGAHRSQLWFAHPAATAEELGLLLRHELHPGIC